MDPDDGARPFVSQANRTPHQALEGCLGVILGLIGGAGVIAAVYAADQVKEPGARMVGVGVCLLAAAVAIGFLSLGAPRK